MDGIRCYLKGLQLLPFPQPIQPFEVPEVTSTELPLRRVQLAVHKYYCTINSVLCSDQLVAMRRWGERMQRIAAWLEVLDAGDDVDRATAALASLPDVGDGMQRESATTIFDEIQALAVAEGKVDADRASLHQAIAFYLAAVERAFAHFTALLTSCDDPAKQLQLAETTVGMIQGYTRRIRDIQTYSESGCGTRPVV